MSKKFTSLLSLVMLSWSLMAQDIYVSPAGDDTNNDGSQDNPFATITRAITEVGEGNTVFILGDGTNNTYTYTIGQTINVNKSLTLSGVGQAVRITTSQNMTDLLAISASGITVEGLILDASGDNGTSAGNVIKITAIFNIGSTNINILQNTIINADVAGISIEGNNATVSDLTISNNFINSNATGLQVTIPLTGNSRIFENDLAGNQTIALRNNSGQLLNASPNWWGSFIPSLLIREISNLTTTAYSPWLAESNDADVSTDGFQADFSEIAVQKTKNNLDALTDAYNTLQSGGTINLFHPVVGVDNLHEDFIADKNVDVINFSSDRLSINSLSTTDNATLTLAGQFRTNNINLLSGQLIVGGSALELSNFDVNVNQQGGSFTGAIVNEPVTLPPGEDFSFLGAAVSAGSEELTNLSIARKNNEVVTLDNSRSIEVIWDINVDQPTFSARTLTLTWDASLDGENNFEGGSEAYIWKSDDEGQTWNFYDTGEADVPGIDLRVLRVENVTDFSQWTVSDVNNPLPVELTAFNARLEEPHVQLNWETASEENADFFAIERSESGQEFTQIGTIRAAGNSDVPLQYSYLDEQAANRFGGTLFYRLRTVDFDGSYEYSDITSVFINDEGTPMISAFAREGQESMKLFTRSIEPGDYHLWVTDLSGRKLYEQKVQLGNNEEHRINIGNLPRSIYMIRCVGKQLVLATKFKVE